MTKARARLSLVPATGPGMSCVKKPRQVTGAELFAVRSSLRAKNSINAGSADAQLLGNLGDPNAFIVQPTHLGGLRACCRGSPFAYLGLRLGNTFSLAL